MLSDPGPAAAGPASLNGVGGEQDRGQPGQGELGRGSGTRLAERLPGEQRGVEPLPVVGGTTADASIPT